MSDFSYQLIPFAFIFLIVLFFLSKKKPKKKVHDVQNEQNNLETHEIFFENAEKKLLALRELYNQGLIDIKIYLNKTEIVSKSITKLTGKTINQLIEGEKNNIYEQIRDDISNKVNKISSKQTNSNLDKLISNVDKRIEMGLKNDDSK